MSAIAGYVDDSQIILLSDGIAVNKETGQVLTDKCKIHRLNQGCAALNVGYYRLSIRWFVDIHKPYIKSPCELAKLLSELMRHLQAGAENKGEELRPYFILVIGYNEKGEEEAWQITNLESGGHEPQRLNIGTDWLFILPAEFGSALEEKTDRFTGKGRNIRDALHLAFSEVVGEMEEAGTRCGGKIFMEVLGPLSENDSQQPCYDISLSPHDQR